MNDFIAAALMQAEPASIIAIFVGSIIGIIFGAIPGLTYTMALSMVLPLTFGISPNAAICMLLSTYIGGLTGGSLTACLIGIPGTPSAAATVVDGYAMVRKGQAGLSLGLVIMASAFGSIFSLLVMVFAVDFGDFVTAPELSPLFAATVAAAIDPVLRALGGGTLLELGPGSGRLAAGVLTEFAALGTPLEEYLLLEPGAALVARQRALLGEGRSGSTPDVAPLPRIDRGVAPEIGRRWLRALPAPFCGVVLANEVIDALPCERFVMQQGAAWRLGVGRTRAEPTTTPGFEWRARPADGACPGDVFFAAAMQQRLQGLRKPGVSGEWDFAQCRLPRRVYFARNRSGMRSRQRKQVCCSVLADPTLR